MRERQTLLSGNTSESGNRIMRKVAAIAAVLVFVPVIVLVTIHFLHVSAQRQTHKIVQSIPAGIPSATTPPTLAIAARIDGGAWKNGAAIYPLKGQKVALRISRVSGGSIRWYQIVPDVSKIYKNANHPWEPNPYKWVGLAKIDYSRTELTKFRGQWEITAFSAAPKNSGSGKLTESLSGMTRAVCDSQYYHNDVGSFWFQVEVEKNGKVERSPGVEDSDKKGLSPGVFRVSVRDGEGYLGYLTTFLNVPGVFGSIPYQSNNYIGIDCCDALVAAYGIWAGKKITKDYSVSMLVSKLPKVTECGIVSGKPDRRIEWGKEIHPGNFIAVRFSGAKSYQHIGALFSDSDKDGVLSEKDIVLHAGPLPLHYSSLGEGCFDGHVVILDSKSSSLGHQ